MLCVASYSGDRYQLDWSHTGVQAAPAEHLASDVPPPPLSRDRLPVLAPVPRPPRISPRVPGLPGSYRLNVAVRHFVDHQKDRYVKVDHIQTTVYRKGSYHTQNHWNVAGDSEVDLVLENLSPGDRYQIEIIWDDGSRRWIDDVVGRAQPGRLYVDEPDAFGLAR
jgi:hypothetical protein